MFTLTQDSAPKAEIGLFSYKIQPTIHPSTHCYLFVYVPQRLFKPADLPGWRLPKARDLPNTVNKVVQLQEKSKLFPLLWVVFQRNCNLRYSKSNVKSLNQV